MFHVKRVRIIAPAGHISPTDKRLKSGVKILQTAGYTVEPHTPNPTWRGTYAGTDAARLVDFQKALAETNDILWFARGGTGTARILDAMIEALHAQPRPRIIIGFSDATSLLNAIARDPSLMANGWRPIHGPVLKLVKREHAALDSAGMSDLTVLDRLAANLPWTVQFPSQGRFEPTSWPPDPSKSTEPYNDRRAGGLPSWSATGRLFGGNLSVLTTLLGTRHQPPSEGTIWLLEDTHEAPYRVDRALTHLVQSGATRGAIGALTGPMFWETRTRRRGGSAKTIGSDRQIPRRVAAEISLPCIADAPIGHPDHLPSDDATRLKFLPLGLDVQVTLKDGVCTVASNHSALTS